MESREENNATLSNIYIYPQQFEQSKGHILLGDTHGNFIKLLHVLVMYKILGVSEEDFEALVTKYLKEGAAYQGFYDKNLDDDQFEGFMLAFKEHIGVMKDTISNIIVLDNTSKITFLGDETCDRGVNDYYTLMLLELLVENGIELEILISNHSMGFIKFYEDYKNHGNEFYVNRHDGEMIRKGLVPATSLENLEMLIYTGIVDEDDTNHIISIIDNCYKPNLKALSFKLSEDEKAIDIYSHAPIGIEAIEDLCNQLSMEYNGSSIKNLAITITTLNQEFKEGYVFQDNLTPLMQKHSALYFVMWNRDYKLLNRNSEFADGTVFFVNGHDIPKSSKYVLINTLCLDSLCGKLNDYSLESKKNRKLGADCGVLNTNRNIPLSYIQEKGHENIESINLVPVPEPIVDVSFHKDFDDVQREQQNAGFGVSTFIKYTFFAVGGTMAAYGAYKLLSNSEETKAEDITDMVNKG